MELVALLQAKIEGSGSSNDTINLDIYLHLRMRSGLASDDSIVKLLEQCIHATANPQCVILLNILWNQTQDILNCQVE